MARIRTIKPEFFRHEGLYEAEKETGLPLRVAFAGLWTAADREGRFEWKPRQLKLDALPYDEVDFSRVLDALTTRGHIVKYSVDGVFYGCIPSWKAHQVINNRESPSSFPSQEKGSIESTTCTSSARVDDASSTRSQSRKVEGKGREGKGKEGEGEGEGEGEKRAKRASPPTCPDGVDEQVWMGWLELRRKKSAPVTEVVIASAQEESAKAGMSLEAFLRIWCFRGSQGLQADWLKPHERSSSARGPTFEAQRLSEKRAEVAKWTGGILGAKPHDPNIIDMEGMNAAKHMG